MLTEQELSTNEKFLADIARLIESSHFDIALSKCDTLIDALKEEDPDLNNPDHLQGHVLKATALLRANHPQKSLVICNQLLVKFPQHTKLLHIKYVSLLHTKDNRPEHTEELNAAFLQITQNDQSEWVALANYLRNKAASSYEENHEKLQSICKAFPNSRVALYLCARHFRNNPNVADHFGFREVSKDIFNQSTPDLVRKSLRAAILKGDFGQLCAIAEYSRPKYFSGIRSKVNLDQFWQNTEFEKDKILALLSASEVKNFLDEVLVYCKNSYLAKDLEAQLFSCFALANKRPVNHQQVHAAYQSIAKQFPDNIFVLSMQPLLEDLMYVQEIPTIEFAPVLEQQLIEKKAQLEALPEDAAPEVGAALQKEIDLLSKAISSAADAEPPADKTEKCVCF